MKLLKSNTAVSHLVGYLLTLMITAGVVSVSLVMTSNTIEEKTSNAAVLFAENLATRIVDAIINVCIMKDQYPNANYSISVDIPNKLADRYDYYIEFSNTKVYINSTNGLINVNSTTFNAPNNVKMDLSGIIYGSQQKLKVSCEESNYVYQFDFGTNSSDVLSGYTKITDFDSTSWNDHCIDWKYKTIIKIVNPLGKAITDYQILIQLNENNFGHYLANPDGSDLRFYTETDNELYYWIERWYYPGEVHTSRVWVKLDVIPAGESYIYMYHGNENADFNDKHNGSRTFIFFDDFEEDDFDSKWIQYKLDSDDKIYVEDGILYLENSSAVLVNPSVFVRKANEPYIIDVKAKASGNEENGSEASMFARFSSGSGAPYKNAHVFSSNSFSSSTLASYSSDIIIWDANSWNDVQLGEQYGDVSVKQGWNRLRFIVNKSDSIAVRYLYDSFTVDGYGSASDGDEDINERFGLCTLVADSCAVGQYDWVFVHKFESDTSSTGGLEDREPIAYVQAAYSKEFKWSNIVYSGEDENGKDFVWSNNEATFLISNLTTSQNYSITFTLGAKDYEFDGLKIDLTDFESGTTKTINVDDFSNYTNVWKSNIVITDSDSDGLGALQIRFYDDADSYYWAVNEMTLEISNRIINVGCG